jgi:hypothetical protein
MILLNQRFPIDHWYSEHCGCSRLGLALLLKHDPTRSLTAAARRDDHATGHAIRKTAEKSKLAGVYEEFREERGLTFGFASTEWVSTLEADLVQPRIK